LNYNVVETKKSLHFQNTGRETKPERLTKPRG